MSTPARSILITGGSRGLGLAIASHLAGLGWTVGLVGRDAQGLAQAQGAITAQGGLCQTFVADVLDRSGLTAAATEFAQPAGLDAFVHAAGRLQAIGPASTVDPELWRADLETTALGFLHLWQACAPWLSQSDAATAIALVGHGHQAELAHASGYAAGQAALLRLVETISQEEAARNRVALYALFPGLVHTQLTARLIDTPEGRQHLPRFNQAFAEGKESDPRFTAEMTAWLLGRRPAELRGRLVNACQTPEIVETRLDRIERDDLGRLRVR